MGMKVFSKKISFRIEYALFVSGMAAGALVGARGVIQEKVDSFASSVRVNWSQTRLPAGAEADSTADKCSLVTGANGALAWQRMRMRSGLCSVYIKPDVSSFPGRGVSFGSHGNMMIFSQFSSRLSDAGAQLYYLFPLAEGVPSVSEAPSSNEIIVRTAAGSLVRFSTETGNISGSSPDLSISVDSNITPGNQGGLRVTAWSGILLDVGFRMGEQPFYKRPNAYATFKDAQGATCRVQNREIYDYSDQEEPRFLVGSNSAALDFLTRRCSNLDLSSFRRGSSAVESAVNEE